MVANSLKTERGRLDGRLEDLRSERQGYWSHWRELSDYIMPRRGRFLASESEMNKGDFRNSKLKDNTPTIAARTLGAGLMAGMTSPSRPWFKLTTPDPDMAEFWPVKVWLEETMRRMMMVFSMSNFYTSIHRVYEENGVFGTGAMLIEEDFDKGIRTYDYTIGEYFLGLNDRLEVDTLFRETPYKVSQLAEWFGVDNLTASTRSMYDQGNYDEPVMVVHCIQPNQYFNPKSRLSRDKKWASVYYEKNASSDEFLQKKGYDSFPVMAPRWDVLATDTYGNSAGMEVLADCKQLQQQQIDKGRAIAINIKPPMNAPGSLRGKKKSLVPGGVTYVDPVVGGQKFEPTFTANLRVEDLRVDIEDTRLRIRQGMFFDLFMMMTGGIAANRRQITAREIEERHEEKLLMLGPVLERTQFDLLDRVVDRTFEIMARNNLLPDPVPSELAGVTLRVEYVSVLAQAQKIVGTTAIERVAGFAGQLAQLGMPNAIDKLDAEQMVDEYSQMIGVVPHVIRDDESVRRMQAERAQAAQLQQNVELMDRAAQGAKNLSDAKLTDENMLKNIVDGARANG